MSTDPSVFEIDDLVYITRGELARLRADEVRASSAENALRERDELLADWLHVGGGGLYDIEARTRAVLDGKTTT